MTKRQRAEAVYRIKPLKWWNSVSGPACTCVFGEADICENQHGEFCLTYPSGWQAFQSLETAKHFFERWYRRHLTKALTKVKSPKVTGKGE